MSDRPDAAPTAERAIIGCFLLDAKRTHALSASLSAPVFSNLRLRTAYEVISSMIDGGKRVDIVTVASALGAKFAVDSHVNVLTFLEKCVDKVASAEHAVEYVRVVQAAYQLRVLKAAAASTIQIIDRGEADPGDAIETLSQGINRAQLATPYVDVITPETYAEYRLTGLRQRSRRAPYQWGFRDLDRVLPRGPVPEEFTVIAGLSGAGKTMFKNALINNWSLEGLAGVSFVPEMGFHAEADRLEALGTNIPVYEFSQVYRWAKDDPRKEKVNREIRMAKDRKLFFVPSKMMTVSRAGALLRMIAATQAIDFVAIDLFDRFTDVAVPTGKTNVVHQRLVELSSYAQEMSFHTLLCVQIRRSVRSRVRQPIATGADIKDSSSYFDSANVVLIIDRESTRSRVPLVRDMMDIYIDKNRVGPQGQRVRLIVETETMRLRDLPEPHQGIGAGEGDDQESTEANKVGNEAETGG